MDKSESVTLAYFSSDYIIDFITTYPIQWMPLQMSRRGGIGDQAGIPPTPAVHEFLVLLRGKQNLFTQTEYFEHCQVAWHEWWTTLVFKTWSGHFVDNNLIRSRLQGGVRAKLYNNFYVSMIDSLHAWAILCEAGWFDVCVMDSYSDAVSKTDLTLSRNGTKCKVALIGPTAQAREDLDYKRHNRGTKKFSDRTTVVQLPISRPKEPGNKRWYELGDFEKLRM